MLARRRGIVAVCLVALAGAGCTGSVGGGSLETPEACFQSIRKAAMNKDIKGVCGCLTDETLQMFAGSIVLSTYSARMAGAIPGALDEANKKKLNAALAVLAKHGVTDETMQDFSLNTDVFSDSAAIASFAAAIDDKPQFVTDMFAAMERLSPDSILPSQFLAQIAGTTKSVDVHGDAATMTVTTETGEDQLEFRKTSQGWKLHIDLEQMSQPAAPAA